MEAQQQTCGTLLAVAGAAKKKDKILTMDPSEITHEMVNKKLRDIVMTRGRRGTDKQEQVRGCRVSFACSMGQRCFVHSWELVLPVAGHCHGHVMLSIDSCQSTVVL